MRKTVNTITTTTTTTTGTIPLNQSNNLVLHPTQPSYPVEKDEYVEQYLVREGDKLQDPGQVCLDGDPGDSP
jgi:hypothetical protein